MAIEVRFYPEDLKNKSHSLSKCNAQIISIKKEIINGKSVDIKVLAPSTIPETNKIVPPKPYCKTVPHINDLIGKNRKRWTRKQLAEWGISWPPPHGWLKKLKRLAKNNNSKTKQEINIQPLKEWNEKQNIIDRSTPEWLQKFASELKARATKEEILLHDKLITILSHYGMTLLFQHPVEKYILDFYIPERKTVIEVDGIHHYTEEQWEKDQERTKWLWDKKRIKVIRFSNDEIKSKNLNKVCNKILLFIGINKQTWIVSKSEMNGVPATTGQTTKS